MSQPDFTELRKMMVQIIAAYAQASEEVTGRAIFDADLIRVMGEVPRHDFVPQEVQPYAYADGPLPIGHDKTISQPFIVALMIDLLGLDPQDKVLEVGTGLGYCAAIMARLAASVYTMEIIEELASDARERLGRASADNVEIRVGNGYYGWPDEAPFDKILVAAAPEQPPRALLEQLKPGGRMVCPLGPVDEDQQLVLLEKDQRGDVRSTGVLPVRFAPLVMAH